MIGGRKRVISSAAMAFVPANTLIALDLGAAAFGSIMAQPSAAEANLATLSAYVRVSDVKLQSVLNRLWDNLGNEVERPTKYNLDQTLYAANEAALAAHAALLGVWLVRNKMPNDQVRPTALATLLAGFTTQMADKLCTSDTVSDYAKALGVTATHLSRVCNSEFGVPASRLLQLTKLYEAQRLFADTNISIQEAAGRVGFESAAYVTRVFQEQTGQNPTSFRAQTHVAPKPPRYAAPGPALTVKLGRALPKPTHQRG